MASPANTAEAAVNQVLGLISTWVRRFAAIGLLILVLLKIASAFPQIPGLVAIASIDWQAFGIFVAGSGFALGTRT
jgi:hypothetical protein